MKTVSINTFGGSDLFEEKDIPLPEPQKGEVRILVKASGFNPVDCKLRKGMYGGDLPLVLGCDCAGVVDAVGEGTSLFQKGDEVIAFAYSRGSNGTYAESVVIPESFVAKKPKNHSFEQAAAIPCAGLTAYRVVVESRAVKEGDSVFISAGSGGVGSFAIELARAFGAKSICTTAGSQESVDYLTQELKIDPSKILLYPGLSVEEMERQLIQMNGGDRFSACFDFVGGEKIKQLCLALADFQGHVGSILDEEKGFPIELWHRPESAAGQKSLSVHFAIVSAEDLFGPPSSWSVYHKNLMKITNLIENDKIRMPRITNLGDFSVETIQKAHALLEKGHVKGKLVMEH